MLTRSIATTIHGRYLVEGAAEHGPLPLIVGFHGYAENATRHLDALRQISGETGWRRVAVQGLHRFYRARTEEVVASWMTREDRDQAITDNIEYVARVVSALRAEHGDGPLVYAGFSQGVATAYRAAASDAHAVTAVVALGGDLPPEVDLAGMARRCTRVLVGRGTADGWYTAEKLDRDLARLHEAGVEVEACVFEGGHEWAPPFVHRTRVLLDAILVEHAAAVPSRS